MKRQHIFIVLTCFLLMSVSACQAFAPVQPTTEAEATITTEMQNNAEIKLSDNGKMFTHHLTDRFSVFLDDEKYPVKDLTCTPDGIIGSVSNGSMRGPDRYPIMFEAAKEGQCRLEDHDFHVDVLVKS